MINKIIEELKYWRKESNGKHANIKEKTEYYKRCYELCKILKWQMKDLKEVEERIGVRGRTIANYARIYALRYLRIPEEDYNEKIYTNVYDRINRDREIKYLDNRVSFVLSQLKEIPITNKKEIIALLRKEHKQYHVSPYNLREKIEIFVEQYPIEDRQKILLSLDEKIIIYINELKKQQQENRKKEQNETQKIKQYKKQQQLEKVSKYINEFTESKFTTIESFCLNNKIDINEMKELLEICRKNDSISYKKYLSKLMTQKNEYNLDAITLGKQLACVIKNGVKLPSGEIRDYDVIDYHKMIKTNFKDTSLIISEDLELEELKIIKDFFKKNQLTFCEKTIEIEKIKEGKTKFGFSIKDENNNTITYYPTREEIELIVNFLEENSIPLNEFNYRIVLKRYLNNTLSLTDSLRRRLTK